MASADMSAGVSSIALALPHRGRLSLLCDPDLIGFSPTALFSKIRGQPEFDPATAPGATGDVISHLSGTKEIDYGGSKVKVQVLQNPSHLEVSSLPLFICRKCSSGTLSTGDKPCSAWGDASEANVADQILATGMPAWG